MSEQDILKDENQQELIADLELAEEEADAAKAGTFGHGSGAGVGKVQMRDWDI